MKLENIIKAKEILDKEFDENMKEEYGLPEFRQLCYVIGGIQVLLRLIKDGNRKHKTD